MVSKGGDPLGGKSGERIYKFLLPVASRDPATAAQRVVCSVDIHAFCGSSRLYGLGSSPTALRERSDQPLFPIRRSVSAHLPSRRAIEPSPLSPEYGGLTHPGNSWAGGWSLNGSIRGIVPQLAPGHYLGSTLRSCEEGGLRLTLCTYEGSRRWKEHTHQNPGVMLLVAGQHRETVRSYSMVQPPMTLLFHPTTVPHSTETGPQGMLVLNMSYDRPWLSGLGIEEGDLAGVTVTLDSLAAKRAALRMLVATYEGSEQRSEEMENDAFDLLAPICAYEAGRTPGWLFGVRDQLCAEFQSPIRLSHLSATASYHPVHICRAFKAHFDSTITEYIQALRLAEAVRLITDGVPIGEAAHRAGFADHAHLCRTSNQWVKRPPQCFQIS